MESTWSFSWLCCFCCSPMLAFWHSSVLGQSQTYTSLNIQIISLNQFLSSSSFSFSASLSFLVDCPSLSRIQVCAIRQHAQTQDSPNFLHPRCFLVSLLRAWLLLGQHVTPKYMSSHLRCLLRRGYKLRLRPLTNPGKVFSKSLKQECPLFTFPSQPCLAVWTYRHVNR